MAKVLVIAEHRSGKLKKATFELIYEAAQKGHEVSAAVLAESPDAFTAELGKYGASKVFSSSNPAFKLYTAEAYTKTLAGLIEKESPEIVLASHTPTGRDLMPHLAAKLNAGLASDCTMVSLDGGLTVRRPVYAGKASAEVEFLGSGPKLLTVRPNTFGAPSADDSKSAEAVSFDANVDGLKTQALEEVQGGMARPDVTEAAIVVSGGRSVGSAEAFSVIETLADSMGAAVGASRAAVDAGYRPHRDQVGQTGKVVSPTLYVACGISGAIQHLAGMRTSKYIVAINTDPEAPIFQLADYGIVGDLFKVAPALAEEVNKLKN